MNSTSVSPGVPGGNSSVTSATPEARAVVSAASAISIRAACPIDRMVWPPLPSTIDRWLSHSTKIVCSMRTEPSDRTCHWSVSTVERYGNSSCSRS